MTQEDITLTRMNQDQLVSELAYFRDRKLLLNAIDRIARVGYYEWCGEKDRLLRCSEEYASIFSMTPAQMVELEDSWEAILKEVHPDDREAYDKASQDLLKTKSLEMEYRIVRQDGDIRHVRETSIVETDRKTGKVNIVGILQDITGLREQRNALEYREALAQQTEAITDIGHFIYNELVGVYTYISPVFARIFDTTAEDYMEKMLTAEADLNDIHKDDLAQVSAIYDRYDEDGEPYSVEYRITRVNGEERWINERCITYSSSEGKIHESLGVVQDITAQKRAEAELLAVQSSLQATVARRTSELAETVKQLETARDSLELQVDMRTRVLAQTVSQLESEIAEREKIEAELKFLANHDALTGLPSLRLCMDRLEMSIAEARRNKHQLWILFIDLDGFKQINDLHGHDYGDRVLKETADRLAAGVRETDTAARIGGDEFLVILAGVTGRSVVERIASSLVAGISEDIQIEQKVLSIGASIGISCYPDHGKMPEDLIRQADAAMYQVKQAGKNNYAFLSLLD